MAALSGLTLSKRTVGGLFGLYLGAKYSPGTDPMKMLVGGAAGYTLGGMF